MSPTETLPIERVLQESRNASFTLATLSSEQKNQALLTLADLVEQQADALLTANAQDLQEQKDLLAPSLYQRLKLDAAKLAQLSQGIRDVARLDDPAGRILQRTLLDDGLELVRETVPLGVIGVIFESRPDVFPQIIALTLKSGNAVVLKGGKEAHHSNKAFYELAQSLCQQCPWIPDGWVSLLSSREDVKEMLNYPQYVDLVIPRGSNELVQSIMASTHIPVMGHADGVCHAYVHASADLAQAVAIALDAKTQYPAACNALETLLVDAAVADAFLPLFGNAAGSAGVSLRGCPEVCRVLPNVAPATDADWRTEYGNLTLSIKVVPSLEAAMAHINHFGSHHTDAILAQDPQALEQFLNTVDSACVFANASTRFADGFRFGFGAEVGISTAKTHARGPVGLDGLVIYKYKLRGAGHTVQPYVGNNPKPFLHQSLPLR
jgi:glutamate-5-semialdehyde dehydrogenase